MRIDDTKMTKTIMTMFAGRPIQLLDKEIPFLYNMKSIAIINKDT